MYMIAAHVVSNLTGSFEDFVSERILRPLRMDSTTYYVSKAEATGKLSEEWTSTGRRVPLSVSDDIAELVSGMGGLVSSVSDMVDFAISIWYSTLSNITSFSQSG